MEFQDFWKQRERMCDAINCHDCIICQERGGRHIIGCLTWISDNPQRAESIIEKWAKENSLKTNADKFKEVFGIDLNMAPLNAWLNKEYKLPKEVIK